MEGVLRIAWRRAELVEGSRSHPAFQRRLRERFPGNDLRIVWDDVEGKWLLCEWDEGLQAYVRVCHWAWEPDETLIEVLQVGYHGGRCIQDRLEWFHRCIDRAMKRQQKESETAKQERRAVIHDARYYLQGILSEEYMRRDVPVLPEKWTRGWRPE